MFIHQISCWLVALTIVLPAAVLALGETVQSLAPRHEAAQSLRSIDKRLTIEIIVDLYVGILDIDAEIIIEISLGTACDDTIGPLADELVASISNATSVLKSSDSALGDSVEDVAQLTSDMIHDVLDTLSNASTVANVSPALVDNTNGAVDSAIDSLVLELDQVAGGVLALLTEQLSDVASLLKGLGWNLVSATLGIM
ncbi:hypothetical protein FISHEDRAFT_69051 [Fistulina hepatica ATCC 64428]|uniref:Uncharacterized protein n=1 Tax=Fistulina hepatica ATCC 64428 TaxID=1128425 RepID=A0A0D7AMX6_9AGAR|nr:hypothetical protein FISHEDRAFT_69051 [Fistulina hepatica ATCC 64428]